jgi:hypothetical protein
LVAWLRKRKARNADTVAATAIEAANAQHTIVPGQQLAAAMVARMAEEVMALDTKIGDTDAMIEERFRRHRHAEIILSMPGFGVTLGAEFLAATGGDMSAFASADRLAGVAGLAPVPRDSGRISGNMKRPRRYNRRLLRTCYLSQWSASAPIPLRAPTTTVNVPKENATPKPSWPWHGDASMSCGPCSATARSTNPTDQQQLLLNTLTGLTTSLRILLSDVLIASGQRASGLGRPHIRTTIGPSPTLRSRRQAQLATVRKFVDEKRSLATAEIRFEFKRVAREAE